MPHEMSSAAGFEGVPEELVGHHFSSLGRQTEAMRLGMWLFLATEVLLFAGLFCGYAVYRYQFPLAFQESSRHLNIFFGTLNTVVLITSSFTVAMTATRSAGRLPGRALTRAKPAAHRRPPQARWQIRSQGW